MILLVKKPRLVYDYMYVEVWDVSFGGGGCDCCVKTYMQLARCEAECTKPSHSQSPAKFCRKRAFAKNFCSENVISCHLIRKTIRNRWRINAQSLIRSFSYNLDSQSSLANCWGASELAFASVAVSLRSLCTQPRSCHQHQQHHHKSKKILGWHVQWSPQTPESRGERILSHGQPK